MARLRRDNEVLRPGGDHYVIDDRTGHQIPASRARKEWTGLIVDSREEWEPRHPQDSVRARADRQLVRDARPPPPDRYGGPPMTTLTADVAAGSTSITVASSRGFRVGNTFSLSLDNGDQHLGVITGIPDRTHIEFTGDPLTWAALTDTFVTNFPRTPVPEL